MNHPVTLPLSAIAPSPTNPRKRFDEEKLAHLGETIRAQGILQKVLVRPMPGQPGVYELVDGERRWRAAGKIELSEVPVEVRELSDAQVIEVQLVAGETSEPLTPIEEAQAIKRALAITEDGQPVYTKASLAAKLGYSEMRLGQLLQVLRLPVPVQAAVERGEMDFTVARLIARIPAEADRLRAASEIMPTATRPEPMTTRQAEAWIRERYTVSLDQAPFALDDELLPGPLGSGQACRGCEFLVAPESQGQRAICSNPACYRSKCNAVWDRRVAKADGEGQRVLSDEETEDVFEKHAPVPQIAHSSPYVDVNAKPDYRHVANEVEDGKLPKWRDLLESAEREKGIKVPVVLARDRNGKQWELVQLSLAIGAVRAIGENIFKKVPVAESLSTKDRFDRDAVRSTIRGTNDFEKKHKAEAKAAKKRLEDNVAAIRGLARFPWDLSAADVVDVLFLVAVRHVGPDGWEICAKEIGLPTRSGESLREQIEDDYQARTPEGKRKLLVQMLATTNMRWEGRKAEIYANFAAITELAVMNTNRGAAPAAEELPPADAKAKRTKITDDIREQVRKLVISGYTGEEIAKQVRISLPSVQKIKKALGFVKARGERSRMSADEKEQFRCLFEEVTQRFAAVGIHSSEIRDRIARTATAGRAGCWENVTSVEDCRAVLRVLNAQAAKLPTPAGDSDAEESAA